MNLGESHVLVTGGGGGVGRHLVRRLAETAGQVAVLEKDQSAIGEITAEHPTVKCYPCDVTDPAAVERSIDGMAGAGFGFDVLVNNAGLIQSAPLINMLEKANRVHSADAWQQVLAANLSSVFYVTGHFVDHMLKSRKKGVVINTSSISANGNPGQSAYSAAKAGVNALTSTWAKELGGVGIRFVSIAPGFLDTPSTRKALSEAMLTKLEQKIPLRKLGDVEHIYQAVRFIVENDYLNGTVIEVDGGLVI
jgi:3-oxoacyl-[acyl-carrier protein] reductase